MPVRGHEKTAFLSKDGRFISSADIQYYSIVLVCFCHKICYLFITVTSFLSSPVFYFSLPK